MKNLIKEIKALLLKHRVNNIKEKFQKLNQTSFANKTSKKFLGEAADLTINSTTLKIIDDVKNNVTAIVKQTNCDPDKLLNYIHMSKTPVYRIDNADKLLRFIKEEEGILYPKKGLEALYLSIITNQGIKFSTEPMFILRNGKIDKFYMLHNFYRWYSLKSDLPGFEPETQRIFKIFLLNNSTDNYMRTLSLEQIVALKEAIARDQEASSFVLEYSKTIEGSKKVINKIKNEGSANI